MKKEDLKEQHMIALNPRETKEQTRAFVTECPLQEYDALTQLSKLKQLEQRINATEVEEYTDDGKTALCPYCSVDSVIGDASGIELNPKLLNELNKMYF